VVDGNTLQHIKWFLPSRVMRGLQALAIVAGLFATYTEGLTLQRRSNGPAKVVGLPIQRRELADPIKRDRLRRRAKTISENLDNEVYHDFEFAMTFLIVP